MIVILVSVAILEVLLIYTVQQNYYGSLKGNLTNQVKNQRGYVFQILFRYLAGG